MTRHMQRNLLVAFAVSASIGADTAVAGLLDGLTKKAQEAVNQIAKEAVKEVAPVVPADAAATAEDQAVVSDGDDGTDIGKDKLVFRTESGKPTLAARELAIVRFRPDVLSDEAWLKRIAGNVDRSRRSWMNTDEFRWRREKDAIKAEILEQAKTVPTDYEITPWPGREVMADLGQYDFNRKAFKMRVHTGASAAWPWRGDNRVQWLPVPPDIAEKMNVALNNQGRLVYAKYKLKIVGVEPKGSGQRVYPFFDDRIEKVDVYTLNGAPFPTTPKNFVYWVSLDTSKFRMKDHAGRR